MSCKMKKMFFLVAILAVANLTSCSDNPSSASSSDDLSKVSFENDPDHEGFVRVKAAGHYTILGTDDMTTPLTEHPSMKVEFDYDFSISKHEITQKEFVALKGGSVSKDDENRALGNMTYGDAILFANAKSKAEGLDTVYTYTAIEFDRMSHAKAFDNLKFNTEVEGYRLPTEAEWVLVASQMWDPKNSWNSENANFTPQIVCQKNKGPKGICDMAGNLAEWVSDWSGYYRDTVVMNYVGAPSGNALGERVIKGGSFASSPSSMNLYSKGDVYTISTDTRYEYIGARLAIGKITNPSWMDSKGGVASALLSMDATEKQVYEALKTRRVKLAFVNGVSNNLVYVNYNEAPLFLMEIEDTLLVQHPDISPDGNWVAFCTGKEGSSSKSELYVRRLDAVGSGLVKLDVKSAVIPRFRVTEEGDTVIVYVSDAYSNESSADFEKMSTWQVPFRNGSFGTPEKLFDGAYHGGVSPDGSFAVSGATRLRARVDSKDTIWYNEEQACNVSLSQDGSKRTLFLDFASGTGIDFVGKDYNVHERMFIADSTGKLISSVGAPSRYTFDFTEWTNLKDFAVASLTNNNGGHPKVVLIDVKDSSFVDLVNGDELRYPAVWTQKIVLPEEERFLDLDSAGVYMTENSNITTTIMKVKMDLFWKYRDSADVVVIGSSRSFSGVNPTEIKSYFALNMAYSAEDMTATEFFSNKYIIPMTPNLKVLVITLDYDRWYIMDEFWNEWFGDIPGYRYDENHDFWKDGVPESLPAITRYSLSPNEEAYFRYSGNRGLYQSESVGWGDENSAPLYDIDWYQKSSESYEYNKKKLISILDRAKEEGIIVVGAIFPQSPFFIKNGSWGRYGLTMDDAKEIEADIMKLEKEYDNFYIFDEYKDGENDYESEDFSNEDHLGLKGAVKYAHRLDSLLVRLLEK